LDVGTPFPFHTSSAEQLTLNQTRSFDRLSDILSEVIDARVWAGIHFRTADVQGAVLGKKVAQYLKKHYFQPVQRGGLISRPQGIANR
jgi:hypothetical protein